MRSTWQVRPEGTAGCTTSGASGWSTSIAGIWPTDNEDVFTFGTRKTVPVVAASYRPAVRESGTNAHVALFPVDRPADVPSWTGWSSLNWEYMQPVVRGNVYASAMLRSWEDRFGARLLVLGNDTMVLAVERSPATRREALVLVDELDWFACESQTSLTPREYADKTARLARSDALVGRIV